MSVGDVTSSARGSGARYNDGKPPLDLLPLRIFATALRRDDFTDVQMAAHAALERLAAWQEGGDDSELYAALAALGNPFHSIARVLDYGRRKYAAWNWSKGMAWSIALACAARHLEWILLGQADDAESGLPHFGHAGCNVVFLIQYHRTFLEGDDRPTTLGGGAPAVIAPATDEPE